MGRPGTPGPGEGRESNNNNDNKATFSGAVVILAIVSFVLGVIAVAIPYWGYFTPSSKLTFSPVIQHHFHQS